MKFTSFQFLLLAASASVNVPVTALKEATESPVEMVSTAHFAATDAGKAVLAKGGTAVDAMIAIQTVLGLVEPQSSGIAGGAFVVYYDSEGDRVTTYDAREKAPSGATEDRFVDADGTNLGFSDAWQSSLSVGVPGVPQMMESLHDSYGRLPWADLFDDATQIATDGFEITSRTADGWTALLERGNNPCNPEEEAWFLRDQVTFDYFMDNSTCTPKPAGTMVTNQDYADLMQAMAADGAKAVYEGPVAEAIVAKLEADRNPSGDAVLTLEDLMNYELVEREPVCQPYHGYQICGMGPPSSGALALGQIFGILDNFNLTMDEGVQTVDNVHLFTQAMRLAFADRNQYVGDTDFITVPVEGMLDADYLTSRAALIDMTTDMGTAMPGTPPGTYDPSAPQTEDVEGGTSHVSIVDQYGNALSMTTTIESFFGSGLMVNGMLLNNQITDFSFSATNDEGMPIANRVQANKRPRSSMSPTIVLDGDGKVAFLSGSPGGSRIIGYTAQSLLTMIDFGLDPQEAANVPHFQNRNGNTELEEPKPDITSDYDFESLSESLTAMNHEVQPTGGETSGLSVIAAVTDDDGNTLYVGGADPRRDGTAGGRASLDDDDAASTDNTGGTDSGKEGSASEDESGTDGLDVSRNLAVVLGSLIGATMVFFA